MINGEPVILLRNNTNPVKFIYGRFVSSRNLSVAMVKAYEARKQAAPQMLAKVNICGIVKEYPIAGICDHQQGPEDAHTSIPLLITDKYPF